MKKIYLFLVAGFLMIGQPVLAIVNPMTYENNKYGIHVVDENDLKSASDLINSSGGDWGYVTIVISENDRNVQKWQKTFDVMRSLHLIPIVRLATRPIGDTWAAPKVEDAKMWAEFLNSLYWVTKNRYVIIFNEPNHVSEWGNSISPSDYAEILKAYSLYLKRASNDFFILPAGLDASAPNSKDTMDEVDFLRSMIFSQPDIFKYVDGWTSHSYPNPGFSGNVSDEGRGTLKTYLWELGILKSLGVVDDLPVFITETGWAHREGLEINKYYYTSETIANFIEIAADNIWNDSKIIAVTPFILNYQSYPFANFSWQKPNEKDFYQFYYTYKSLVKALGKPELHTVFSNFDGLALQNLSKNDTSETATLRNNTKENLIVSLFSHLFNL